MIADIFKVLLVNDDGFEWASATMESAGFKITNETVDVEGGGGLVAVLHLPKKETVTLKDPVFSFDILAKQLGSDIVVAIGEAYAFPQEYVVALDGSDKIITLDKEPKTPNDVKVYGTDGIALILTTDYTVVGKEVTLLKTGINVGDSLKVGNYLYATDAQTQTIEINNSKFPKGVKCILKTLEIDNDETPLNYLQIILDKCTFDGDISIDTVTKRDATRQDINLKVIDKLGESKVAGRIVREPIV